MTDDDLVGSAGVEIVPVATGWLAKAKAQILPQAEELAREIGGVISDEIEDQVRTALSEGLAGSGTVAKQKGRETGAEFGGEFGKQAQARIRAALAALPKAEIGVATTEAEQKLKDLRAQMAMLGDAQIGVDLSASEALAEMARLQAELELLAASDVDIDVRVDTGKAIAELAAFQAFAQSAGGGGVDLSAVTKGGGGLASNLASAASSMGPLVAGAVVLSTTIGPIVAAAGGIAAALAAPIGAATVGGFLLGGVGMLAVKDVEETRKAIFKLVQEIDKTDDPKKLAELKKQLKDIRADLTDGEKAYFEATSNINEAINELMRGPAGDTILGVISDGLELLADLLPETEPLLIAMGEAVRDILDSADPEAFGAWIDKLAELAGPATKDIVSILGDVGGALDAVLTAGTGTGESALSGIADAAERLNEYLRSPEGQQELQEFFEWLATDGRDAGEALWDMAGALTDFFIATEPLGSAILDAATALAELYAVSTEFLGIQWDVLTGDLGGAFDTVRTMADGVAQSMTGTVNVIRGLLRGLFNVLGETFDRVGDLFDALGKVPGFGWAKEAADLMHETAAEARRVAAGLEAIPNNTNPKINLKGAGEAISAINTVKDGLYRLTSGVTVPVRIRMDGAIPNLNDIYKRAPGKAAGGPVYGPGTGTSDDVVTRLSNGEHVWTAAEVQAAGGHDAVLALRKAMLSGGMETAATGAPATSLGGLGRRDIENAVAAGTRLGMRDVVLVDAQSGRSIRLQMMGA